VERTSRSTTHEGATEVSTVIEQNIQALLEKQKGELLRLSLQDRIAGAITSFAGSMAFVYIHLGIFGSWILINLRVLPVITPFDPTLVVLAMVASVEAIFISTFVLISQNKMAAENEKRAELSLQISLLAEHETTRIIAIVSAIAEKLQVGTGVNQKEIDELKQDVSPEAVLEEIERRKPD
jgi:uncharacterized membrane protein